MADTITTHPAAKSSSEYEAIADQLLAEMQKLETLMRTDRIEIDRLKAETHLLRNDSVRLEAETRASLSHLKAVFA